MSPEKAGALETGIKNAFEHRFIGSSDAAGQVHNRQSLIEEISALAQTNLNEKETAALKAAFAKGIRPLPEDGENPKGKPAGPACCRFPSQS